MSWKALILVAICTLGFGPEFVASIDPPQTPRTYREAWRSGFRNLIMPNDPVVQEQLHILCPVIDEWRFTVNLLAVYTYSMLIPYAFDADVHRGEFWQTAAETLSIGRGDCEDKAITLATLIEALYEATYGVIPANLVWVAVGEVQAAGGSRANHAWVLVNEGLLPWRTIHEIQLGPYSELTIDVILGGVANLSNTVTILEAQIDLAALPRVGGSIHSVFYSGERYFELEPTWNLSISQFWFRRYPCTQVEVLFNSGGYALYPDFIWFPRPRDLGAEVRNVAFPRRPVIGSSFTINVTVQNNDCGLLGADLCVILKNHGAEISRQSAYVYQASVNFVQLHTFVFNLQAAEPAQTETLSAELYWDDLGDWLLQDYKNFTLQTIPNQPDLCPYVVSTIPRHPSAGQLVIFTLHGQNTGPLPSGPWVLEFSIDGQVFDWVSTVNVDGFSGFSLSSKSWVATPGDHSVHFALDALSMVSEIDETNNGLQIQQVLEEGTGGSVYVQVADGSDDCQRWNNTSTGEWQWNLTDYRNVAGCPYSPAGGDSFGCGLRFLNITIPRHAIIDHAHLELCGAWDDGSPVKTKIYGQNAANPATFSTLEDFESRTWTTSFIYWDNIPEWQTNSWYSSPTIAGVIQEIVNRPDWQQRDSLVLVWEDFESRSISYTENARRAWSHEYNTSLAPKLLIDYHTAPQTLAVPDEFPTIQAAINYAVPGDTVFVMKGTYRENVVVNKTITLRGEDRDLTKIVGNGTSAVISVSASNVTIEKFTIQNGTYGVHVMHSHYCNVSDNVISALSRSDGTVGVNLAFSNSNIIESNRIFQSWCGLRIHFSSLDNQVLDNEISESDWGLIQDYHSHRSVITRNSIRNAINGVTLRGSRNNEVTANNITDTYRGLTLSENSSGIFTRNVIANCTCGIELHNSNGSIIVSNSFINNSDFLYRLNSYNTWDNGHAGNYWSNYNGTDLNSDGVGDTNLPWEAVDSYPLMNPHMLGDVNHDAIVDIFDCVAIALAFGASPPDSNWNPHCDIAESYGVIDIMDLVTVALHFEEEWGST